MILDRPLRFLLVYYIRHSFYGWDRQQLHRYQQKCLAGLLRYVAQHSPYYKKLRGTGWDGTFGLLPMMSKNEMLTHFDQINTAGLHQADLVEFAVRRERGESLKAYRGGYLVGLSSGTSGIRLPTVLSSRERWQYGSVLFARSGIPEHLRRPRVLFALRVNNPAFMEVRFLGVTICHTDYTRPIADMVQLINEKRLNVLAGPPSLLQLIAQHKAALQQPIATLISYAEVLDDKTRQQLQQDFQAPVAQIYQGAEGFIASTCRKGNLHLNEDLAFIETLDAGDTAGNAKRLVVTDLHRKILPFLRYQLNDIIEIEAEPCACGSVFRRVGRIHGRADDIFCLHSRKGEEIRFLFPDYVTRAINQASEEITEFQAIQHNMEQIEIRLQLRVEVQRAEIEAQIMRNLEYWAQRVDGRLGEVKFTNALPERNVNSLKLIRVVRRF
jgi:putative adenylate-forming enzyme